MAGRQISPDIILNEQLIEKAMLYYERQPLGITAAGYTLRADPVFHYETCEEFPVTPCYENFIGITPVVTTIALQVLSQNTMKMMFGGLAKKGKIVYPDPDQPVGKRTDNAKGWKGELILKPFEQKVGFYIRGFNVRPKLTSPWNFGVTRRMEAVIEFTFMLDNNAKKCLEVAAIFN